jgi:hypothetical protein
MKVSEVIEQLEEQKRIHGDLEVIVYADHGQTGTHVYSVCPCYCDEDGETQPIEEDEEDLCHGMELVIEIAG